MDWASCWAHGIMLGMKDLSMSCKGVGYFSLGVVTSHTNVSGNYSKSCIFILLLYISITWSAKVIKPLSGSYRSKCRGWLKDISVASFTLPRCWAHGRVEWMGKKKTFCCITLKETDFCETFGSPAPPPQPKNEVNKRQWGPSPALWQCKMLEEVTA